MRMMKQVRPQINTAELVRWYTEQHLTLRQIGRLYGVSAQTVMTRLHKAGVSRQDGEHITRPCAYCGAGVTRTRSQGRRQRIYCGTEHFYADMENPDIRERPNGGQRARAAVATHYPLGREQVVYHKNGDQRDNAISNLAVYASQAELTAMLKGRQVAPVWDGAPTVVAESA